MNDKAKQQKRILIIDDDLDTRELLEFALTKHNHEVILRNNGQEAITYLKSKQVDLLIVDIMMPVMDGLRFLHWLRQIANKDIPVLVLTGVASQYIETEAIEAGANAVIIKPGRVKNLLAKIDELLQS